MIYKILLDENIACLMTVLGDVVEIMRQEEETRLRQEFINLSPAELEILYDREKFWGKRGWGWWFVR